MRVAIPKFTERSELFAYLKCNEEKIIKQKKSMPITSDIFDYGCLPVNPKQTLKEDGSALNPDEIEVNAVANLSGWCDTYQDVMIKDSWKKTIQDKSIVYHLKNHRYSTDDIVGKQAELYTKNFALSYFGIESDIEKAQALMMRSIVSKKYDDKTFYLYSDNEVKQHSIGLRYITIKLCLDSKADEDKEYKKSWDKYYPEVINKEKVDALGFFWAVVEARILENSCVLFGANQHTPTYSTASKEEIQADDESLENAEPSDDDTQEKNEQFINFNL